MFIECSLNNNKNNLEWFKFISEILSYQYENRDQLNKKKDQIKQKQILSLFFEALKINEKIFSERIEIKYSYNCSYPVVNHNSTRDMVYVPSSLHYQQKHILNLQRL